MPKAKSTRPSGSHSYSSAKDRGEGAEGGKGEGGEGNCNVSEELELELEPFTVVAFERATSALRALAGKGFTVVAFDFGFASFLGRMPLTFSCTTLGS